MEFGTLVLSVDRGLQESYQMIDRRHREVMIIKPGKFIFERPDNGKMIVEIDGYLGHEVPSQLFVLNQANVEYFKDLIKKRYDEKVNRVRSTIEELVEQKKLEVNKVNELQANIDSVKAKNKVEFSENREKTIRQVSKALRKHQNRITAIHRNIEEQEEKIEKYEKSKQYSLDIANQDMKDFL